MQLRPLRESAIKPIVVKDICFEEKKKTFSATTSVIWRYKLYSSFFLFKINHAAQKNKTSSYY